MASGFLAVDTVHNRSRGVRHLRSLSEVIFCRRDDNAERIPTYQDDRVSLSDDCHSGQTIASEFGDFFFDNLPFGFPAMLIDSLM